MVAAALMLPAENDQLAFSPSQPGHIDRRTTGASSKAASIRLPPKSPRAPKSPPQHQPGSNWRRLSQQLKSQQNGEAVVGPSSTPGSTIKRRNSAGGSASDKGGSEKRPRRTEEAATDTTEDDDMYVASSGQRRGRGGRHLQNSAASEPRVEYCGIAIASFDSESRMHSGQPGHARERDGRHVQEGAKPQPIVGRCGIAIARPLPRASPPVGGRQPHVTSSLPWFAEDLSPDDLALVHRNWRDEAGALDLRPLQAAASGGAARGMLAETQMDRDAMRARKRAVLGGHDENVSADRRRAGTYLAIDCEMVGVGYKGSESILARVSVVNWHGYVVLDTFVRPKERVTDYRTWVSGIRAKDLRHAPEFEEVQRIVADLIGGRVLIGHAIQNDLSALMLTHPRPLVRDTATFPPLRDLAKTKHPGLKKLALLCLGIDIQVKGEPHDSVEDARATMAIYKTQHSAWQASLRHTAHPSSSGGRAGGSHHAASPQSHGRKAKAAHRGGSGGQDGGYPRQNAPSQHWQDAEQASSHRSRRGRGGRSQAGSSQWWAEL